MSSKIFFVLCLLSIKSHAAIYIASNVLGGVAASDAVFENSSTNSLLSGGIVALGYFNTNAYVPSSDLGQISATIGSFTTITSAIAGGNSDLLSGSFAGFAQGPEVTGVNPTIDRVIYVFVGNASTLATSNAFALKQVGKFVDSPNEQTFTANIFGGSAPVIGSTGFFTGDAGGQGSGTFQTLKLAAIPETSATLLGALGALVLLRRRRN